MTGTTGSIAGTSDIYVEATDAGSRIYAMATLVNTLRIFGGPDPAQAGALLDAGPGSVGALGLQDLGGACLRPGNASPSRSGRSATTSSCP